MDDILKTMETLRQQMINQSRQADEQVDKIEDKATREFLKQSLRDAHKGALDVDGFLNQLKNITNANTESNK